MQKKITSLDIIEYSRNGFDNADYLDRQSKKILERIDKFRNGKLYLEVGGKFMYDPHAARVLPGFDPRVKQSIFSNLRNLMDIVFSVHADDIENNRLLTSSKTGYNSHVSKMLNDIEEAFGVKPRISVNLIDISRSQTKVEEWIDSMKSQSYNVYKRYRIKGYPDDTDTVLSESGYGRDEYIESNKNLILVLGAASNSGKMSTCLGQIYQDNIRGMNSGYAKYETFPIWNLPLNHPVNLAYEAATADIGDYNEIDPYHLEAYGKRSVNYNRDIAAFTIIKSITDGFIKGQENYINSYNSPTDMGINYAGRSIIDDETVCIASLHEIKRRQEWYKQDQSDIGRKAATKCSRLINQAESYMLERSYSTDLSDILQ